MSLGVGLFFIFGFTIFFSLLPLMYRVAWTKNQRGNRTKSPPKYIICIFFVPTFGIMSKGVNTWLFAPPAEILISLSLPPPARAFNSKFWKIMKKTEEMIKWKRITMGMFVGCVLTGAMVYMTEEGHGHPDEDEVLVRLMVEFVLSICRNLPKQPTNTKTPNLTTKGKRSTIFEVMHLFHYYSSRRFVCCSFCPNLARIFMEM